MYDDMGNINNVMEVQVGSVLAPGAREVRENLESHRICPAAIRVRGLTPLGRRPVPAVPQEYVPENLESLVGFDPPPSPPSRSGGAGVPGGSRGKGYHVARAHRCAPHQPLRTGEHDLGAWLPQCTEDSPPHHSHHSHQPPHARPVPRSYACPPPVTEDFLKEPPLMPPQLQLSLLNVPPAMDAIAALPRPQHVILNHIYLQASRQPGAGARSSL